MLSLIVIPAALTWNVKKLMLMITRMVQLPATAAIEYVAACWVPGAGRIFVGGTRTRTKTKTRTRTITKTKTRTKTKTVRGAYARSPPSSMPIPMSRLSVPSIA